MCIKIYLHVELMLWQWWQTEFSSRLDGAKDEVSYIKKSDVNNYLAQRNQVLYAS